MDDSPSAFEDIYAKLRVSRKVDLLKNVAREKLYDENLISAQKGGMQICSNSLITHGPASTLLSSVSSRGAERS
jgi:hypothetical protein